MSEHRASIVTQMVAAEVTASSGRGPSIVHVWVCSCGATVESWNLLHVLDEAMVHVGQVEDADGTVVAETDRGAAARAAHRVEAALGPRRPGDPT